MSSCVVKICKLHGVCFKRKLIIIMVLGLLVQSRLAQLVNQLMRTGYKYWNDFLYHFRSFSLFF